MSRLPTPTNDYGVLAYRLSTISLAIKPSERVMRRPETKLSISPSMLHNG